MRNASPVHLPRPSSGTAAVHFAWLFAAAVFLFAGVIWSGSKAHAVTLSPAEAAVQESARDDAARAMLLGRLQLAGIAQRRAGPPRAAAPETTVAASKDVQDVALARYVTALGASAVEASVAQSGSLLAQRVLEDQRIDLDGAGYADVASGRVDPRILAVLLYLAETHGQVGVSCLVTGHSRFVAQTAKEKKRKAPRRVSAHVYGRAVDISSIGGISVIGNQQPGGIVDEAIQELLSLPPSLQPRQAISLLDLSGPSFRLPDHSDHLHLGY